MPCKMPRPNEDVSPTHGISTTVSPSFTIPPHVLGRTVHNPTIDSTGPGRRPQKPRPGMRVPYRNLTSQIVTQDEIAEEILKRQIKRNSSHPRVVLVDNIRSRSLHFGGSGDTTFAKSLSQKLANQLSSQADAEEKPATEVAGNNGVLWPQIQVETSEQSQFVSGHGCYPIKEKQSVEVIHGESNGIEVPILSHKKPSISPRINHHKTSKLDKEAEKEIALKQLKELPMIKDSESAVRRKNLLKSDTNMQLSLSMTTLSDVKSCSNFETKDCSGSDEKLGVNTSGENSSDIGITLLSTHNCGNVKLKDSEAKSVHPPVSIGTGNNKRNEVLNKLRDSNKYFLKKTKFRGKKILKLNLSNGHCKKLNKEIGFKRRSARLSDKDALAPVKKGPSKEVPLSSNSGVKNRKRGRPSTSVQNNSRSARNSSNSPVTNPEANSVESSAKRTCVRSNNVDVSTVCKTSPSHCGLVTPITVKIEPSCALKTPVDHKAIEPQLEMNEIKVSRDKVSPKQSSKEKKPGKRYATEVEKLLKDEGAATMLLQTGSLESGENKYINPAWSDLRKTGKKCKREWEKLFNDEGVVNMLLATQPNGPRLIVNRKMERSLSNECRRTTRQRILYKASLARKSVMQNSALPSRLRPKTLFKRKKDLDMKRKLEEKKRQLFSKKCESNSGQLERKAGSDNRKGKEEKKDGTIEKKIEGVVEMIDISKSPPKEEIDSSMLLNVSAKASRIIRRHSSSSSFSSRSSSPAGLNCKDKRGSGSSNSAKEISYALYDQNELGQITVSLESLSEFPVKSNVNGNRLGFVSRCSNTRKVVAVPRMSAAVRLKLNSEMSKNFQKGLNIENAKNVSAKLTTPTKTKKSPAPSEQSLKLDSPYELKLQSPSQSPGGIKPLDDLTEVKEMPLIDAINDSQSPNKHTAPAVQSSSNVPQMPTPVKGLELINGGELAVCVKKLQERKDVSITAISDCGERRLEFSNSIPASRPLLPSTSSKTPTPSVAPRQSASSPGVLVEVVPKLKKIKNPKAPFLKNIMGKEHRIVGLPLSPIASYNSVIKSLENVAQKHKKRANNKIGRPLDSKESFRQRSSGRQNAGTYNYKEICLRRYENFVQVILTPGSTKMKNSLNVQVLHEFRDALQQLRRDEFCRVVLVTSTGSTFCQGLDLHSLLHTNIERRKKAAQELSEALKEFLRVLAMFNKPIVAGVHGAAVGLGVTMLPFFDVVYASDKATFHAPYARLGQIPEGAAVLTLPLMLGNAVTSELLFGSRKLTASEALHYGLVTRVFWPDTFQEELIPNIRAMATQSSQSMQAMKALLRLNLRVKLEATLDSESSLLVQHWCSPECQRNFRKFLETSDEVFLQRQKKEPC
ncbi:uncharacterized protein [Hetaerina americana]|uniref:uncharacterized protein n=1 Tax=Hetaerina americana TaxID=62018 RepID=UPI003A7F378E